MQFNPMLVSGQQARQSCLQSAALFCSQFVAQAQSLSQSEAQSRTGKLATGKLATGKLATGKLATGDWQAQEGKYAKKAKLWDIQSNELQIMFAAK